MSLSMSAVETLLASGGPGEVRVPISRKALPAIFESRQYRTGAEIGVWHGKFSEAFCLANPNLQMLSVDAWESFHGYVDTKAKSVEGMQLAEASARERLSKCNCDIRKGASVDVAKTIPDRSLDFVFIDANHSYEAVRDDLRAWVPKVKSGGIISGHDYCVNPAKPFINVIPAVQEYLAACGIRRWYILDADRTPSFYWVNP